MEQTFFEAQLCHVVASVVPEQHHTSGFQQETQFAEGGLHSVWNKGVHGCVLVCNPT